MKKCSKCGNNKELNEFYLDKNSSDGYYAWCKECKRNYDTRYRKSSKVLDYSQSKTYRDRKREYWINRMTNDPRILILRNAKSRAKSNNLPFNITIEDIIIPELCPLLEIPLLQKPYGERTGFHMNSPSLDRIEPSLGYIKGNIIVISMKANAMKYSATLEELKTFCRNSLKLFNNDNNNMVRNTTD